MSMPLMVEMDGLGQCSKDGGWFARESFGKLGNASVHYFHEMTSKCCRNDSPSRKLNS